MSFGPVSTALEREVREEVRRRGIVVWLDKDGTYTNFVDGLASRGGEFPYPVAGFRGSFLDLLLKLEPLGTGLDQPTVLIHMPGFTEDTVRKTPVLELYEPGMRFRKALDTLVREAAVAHVAPTEVDKFLARGPSLQDADEWLAASTSQRAVGLLGVLEEFGATLLAAALAGANSALHGKVQGPEDVATLRAYLHKLTGLDDAWASDFGEDPHQTPLENLLAALGAWILCVEYVHDLRRSPTLPKLARLQKLAPPLVKACAELTNELRAKYGDAYVRLADEVEGFLAEELKGMTADDLGSIDTFREEENRVLAGAVGALHAGDWAKARGYCEARHGERSFWLQRDQTRRWAWSLVQEAAEFGETLTRLPRPLEGARSLEEATERYAREAYVVDNAHRRFEQRRLAVLESRLPHFGPLQEVATQLRRLHRQWGDTLARDFSAVCQKTGFLPPGSLRQRSLFEEVVHPLTLTGDKVAYFVIDAFRFEMATELLEELRATPGTVVDLKPRLAELPSITSVGMNALAPVTQGDRLVVAGAFKGFKTGEFTVRTPEDRARAMGSRSSGKQVLRLSLANACETPTAKLTKEVRDHGLVVVESREIDDAGEANVGLHTFEATLRQIKAAFHHLQLAGVKQFVFTADHGFLIQDETTRFQPYGRKVDPGRRHVLDDHPRQEAGMVSVSVSSLGYEGVSGYLLFREDTAAFDTGKAGATFTHGGNSPQERIIPVLTVTRKRSEAASLAEYMLEAEPLADVMGVHRIRVRLAFARMSSTGLAFATARSVEVSLRVLDKADTEAVPKDASGAGSLKNGRVVLPLGEAWTEVFFVLEGPKDDRARIEVHHPDNIERVQPAAPDHWFSVTGRVQPSTSKAEDKPPADTPLTWADAIANEDFRRVFLHIEKHGVITEPELTGLLGSPRAFRRFSVEFDIHLAKLPFRVRVESGEGGKRYVKEGDK